MSSNDLGSQPAHPFAQTSESYQITGTQHVGMTKREEFAKAALQGVLANPAYTEQERSGETSDSPASAALCHADELVALLAKDGAA